MVFNEFLVISNKFHSPFVAGCENFHKNPLGQNPLLTESPQNILPDKIPLDINPSGQNLLETESPHKKIVSKKHIWTKTPRTNPTKDKIPYRQYPLGQNPLPI